MTLAIETTNLQWQAGRSFAIEGLDLRVPAGAIYGFLGPNGSGKTTTIRLLLGLLRPRAGEIGVLGHAIPGEAPAALARIGYVPERPHLYASMSVAEAIRYHAAFYPRWDQGRADQLLGRFALPPIPPLSRLSKGETGKLALLLALATTPDLLVLDEPTDGLDPVVRREVLTALAEYVSERGATVFISSHLVHELERFCDWVGVMDRGRLVAELPMESFKNSLKRLRVKAATSSGIAVPGDLPFSLLLREPAEGSVETWVVRGWESSMAGGFGRMGAELREVMDLDLEEGFVELLRSARMARREGP